ncbi:DUF5681 domain-containing protein [Mucilaginibacter sp. KACC 22773]|uniref:DUF5681 domain-containing protein n=1 Tax=Mucilaginibacter sp. KACC 22773 TaxID=3025671 RepID=UPI00236677E9|nr:DUF5681 domain-containing protein [Mucilaginibacter sp. KACC 22773]WDF79550.1 DUF5681 domain-containing protein [Mucilaginibacter sp. KACC 22773]
MAFKAGQSGNPNGRPPGTKNKPKNQISVILIGESIDTISPEVLKNAINSFQNKLAKA